MKETQRKLSILYVAAIAIAVAMAVLFETGIAPVGLLPSNGQTEFIVATAMELITLVAIPMALRLFKFATVARSLVTDGAAALLRWGAVRIAMLGVPLLFNTLLYYMYMATAFGYMAIILLISMVFIYPSEGRCEAETERKEDKTV